MANFSRRKRGDDEYVFVDGRAVRADEVVRIDVGDTGSTIVPGQGEEVSVPGAKEAARAAAASGAVASGVAASAAAGAAGTDAGDAGTADIARRQDLPSDAATEGAMRRGFRGLRNSNAFELTPDAQAGEAPIARTEDLGRDDRRVLHIKYAIFGAALIVAVVLSLGINHTDLSIFDTPIDVIRSIGWWFNLTFTSIFNPEMYGSLHREAIASVPYYDECIQQIWIVAEYVIAGAILAVSGMLFQNTFRNPIAAPSMLGISNGINFALFILVMQFGYEAMQHMDLYYIYSAIGGLGVLILVIVGGSWISGPGRFNVTNMILMGTVISQLLGVILTYAEAFLMDESSWDAYYLLQNGTTATDTIATYLILIVGAIIAIVPIFVFRFGLNLVSFSDEESRLLGINPNRMRVMALACGSLMLLVAQLTVGQVAMVSLIIPFIVRSAFGSEFRKQLFGNLLVGSLLLLVCNDIGTFITIEGQAVGSAMIIQIVTLPLFVWMLAVRQRSWE